MTLKLPTKKVCLCTFDSGDSVLSVLGLVLCGLSLCRVLHRMLVHAGVSRQQTHVVLLAVVADGSPVTEGLLQGLTRGSQLMSTLNALILTITFTLCILFSIVL